VAPFTGYPREPPGGGVWLYDVYEDDARTFGVYVDDGAPLSAYEDDDAIGGYDGDAAAGASGR
jgi:hypothetical protein